MIENLADELRQKVQHGDYGAVGRLPSLSEISKSMNIGRSSIYNALLILQAEGLVVLKGKHYYANTVLPVTANPTPTFEQVIEGQGAQSSVENIIEPEQISLPEDIAILFKEQAGALVIHRYRVQGKVDIPYRTSEYWYPEELASRYLQQMKDDPSFDTLEEIKRDLGITDQKVHDVVLSRIPTRVEAKLLQITRSSPVQEVRRTNRAESGALLMLHRIVFVGPYSQLEYDYDLPKKV